MPLKKCPVCEVPVKVENLERHVKRQHPSENIDLRDILTKDEIRKTQEFKALSKPKMRGKLAWPLAIIMVIIVVIATIVAINLTSNQGPGSGDIAPDFTLTSSTNTIIRLTSYRGIPLLLNFMDVDCGWCRQEAGQTLSVLYQEYKNDVIFISVDVNFVDPVDTNDRINTFKETYLTPWEYALDSDGSVRNAYKVESTPQVFIIDENGYIAKHFIGITLIDNYRNILNTLIS